MERVSVARMATAKLQGWIHAARGMGVSGSVTTELNSYQFFLVFIRVHSWFQCLRMGFFSTCNTTTVLLESP